MPASFWDLFVGCSLGRQQPIIVSWLLGLHRWKDRLNLRHASMPSLPTLYFCLDSPFSASTKYVIHNHRQPGIPDSELPDLEHPQSEHQEQHPEQHPERLAHPEHTETRNTRNTPEHPEHPDTQPPKHRNRTPGTQEPPEHLERPAGTPATTQGQKHPATWNTRNTRNTRNARTPRAPGTPDPGIKHPVLRRRCSWLCLRLCMWLK